MNIADATVEVGSERLRALSKEQLLDYLLCTKQNERRAHKGVGESGRSEQLQASRPVVVMKPTGDGYPNKEPEVNNAVGDETNDDHMKSDLFPNRKDRARGRALRPSCSKTSIPHRSGHINSSHPTISRLDGECLDSGYQIGHSDAHMNGSGVGRRGNHNGKQEQATTSAKDDYAKSEQSRDEHMRLSEKRDGADSSKSWNRQGTRRITSSGGWRPHEYQPQGAW